MVSAAELLALAERVEALTVPDREVDADLWGYTQGVPIKYLDAFRANSPHALNLEDAPPYTASLDAALSLVPEGCLFTARTLWDGPVSCGYGSVNIYTADNEDSDGKRHVDGVDAIAATPALALTAAVLRARAAQC